MAGEAKPKRAIALSTYVVAVLVLIVGGIINCGGVADSYEIELKKSVPCICSGWPCYFAIRKDPDDAVMANWRQWWRVDLATHWQIRPMGMNAVAWLAIASAVGAYWNWRSQRQSFWRFSLREIFLMTTVAALSATWFASLYRDRWADERLKAMQVNQPGIHVTTHADYLARSWFWETIGAKRDRRPYYRKELVVQCNGTFENVHTWRSAPNGGPANKPSSESYFNYSNPTAQYDVVLPADILRELNNATYARSLAFSHVGITPHAGLRLDRLHQLELIEFFDCRIIADITAASTKQLRLENVLLSDAGVAGISQLSNLTSLEMVIVNAFPEEQKLDWSPLRRLQKLETVSIDARGINDSALEALAQLPRLRVLNLRNAQISDAGLLQLRHFPALREFHLDDSIGQIHSTGLDNLAQALKGRRLDTFTVNGTNGNREAYQRLKATCPELDSREFRRWRTN